MTFDLRSCETVTMTALHRSLCAAFSDYLVPMSPSPEAFAFRLKQRGYDPSLSRVAVIDGEIAAFWLIGADPVASKGLAYVIATGTLAQARGRGLARAVFGATRAGLAERGVQELDLEVIAGNAAAQRLYQALGFRPRRRLACYDLPSAPDAVPAGNVDLRSFEIAALQHHLAALHDWQPSWQNSVRSLLRSAPDCHAVGAFAADRLLGYGVLVRPTSTIAQLAVASDRRRRGLGSAILARLADNQARLRILNVDHADRSTEAFFENRGARIETVQIEMVRQI